MKRKSLFAQIIDLIVISFCVFLITFVWCGKLFNQNKLICYILSISITLLLSLFFLMYLLNKNKDITKQNNNKFFLKNCLNFLKFCNKNEYISFISTLFCSKYLNEYYFKNKYKTFYINLRRYQNENDFFKINDFYKENLLTELILVCEGFDENFVSLVEESKNNFLLYDSQSFISLLSQTKLYPISISKTLSKKQKIYNYVNRKKISMFSSITKKHFKDFFFSGTSLIILSMFVPFVSYYIYFGTLLLIVSIICLLNDYKSNIPNSNLSLSNQIKRDD